MGPQKLASEDLLSVRSNSDFFGFGSTINSFLEPIGSLLVRNTIELLSFGFKKKLAEPEL